MARETLAPSGLSPSLTTRVVYENGLPVEINGERVFAGSDIAARTEQSGQFLVVGKIVVGQLDCAPNDCPLSDIAWLAGPHLMGARQPLLSPAGLWWPAEAPYWPGNVAVLRVERWSGTCRWTSTFCSSGVRVDGVLPPLAE